MKIIMISDAIYPYNKGGKEKKIYELSTRFVKKGHEVHIYTMKWWSENTKIVVENGVYLHAISPLYPLYTGKRRSFKEAIFFALHCFSLLKENFDVIDVDHMPHLIIFPLKLVCLLKRKKLFVSWNEVWGRTYWNEYIGLLGWPAYLIEYITVRLPDKIISISEFTTKKLQEEFHRTQQLVTVNMGIHYSEIAGVAPAQQTSDVIFAGRFLANKNIDLLIRAITVVKKEIPKIKAIIVGDGPEKNKLKSLITELQLEKNITLMNFLPDHKDLYALFKSSKIFAFPSTREGFGIVVLEANACGLPAIVIDHKDNASKNLIGDCNGRVIPFGVTSLATSITDLLRVERNPRKISNFVKAYDWDSIAARTLEVYQQ